jgi:D-alanyl-D-alanine carboxypeptidase/D-alanyl-D-alanine-endopeptidase (penicillin-binding protein 4)
MTRIFWWATVLTFGAAVFGMSAGAQTIGGAGVAGSTFNQFFDRVKNRPQFAHSNLGVEIYSLDRKAVLFQWNGDKLFVSASTTKLLTEGTALQLLGADYRFHTAVYRTGEIRNGTLKGNLVLVASGDPDLSGRRQPDGTLAFADEDHSYGGFDSKLVPGDPVAPLNDLAQQIAAAGIHKIAGQVLIDASLYPEGDRELGTGVTISPVIVNDNVVDAVIAPGSSAGAKANIRISPQPSYIRYVNMMTTGTNGSKFALDRSGRPLANGDVEVTFKGSIPADRGPYIDSYPVASPSRFAAALLTAALANKGVAVTNRKFLTKPTGEKFKISYTPENRVAEHISAPFSEDVKITLKVSQNLHASSMPFLLGAVLGKAKTSIDHKGFELERNFLTQAGLDLSGAVQADGAGGSAMFTPDFMAHYLAYKATQPDYSVFRNALPVLGKDGTLFDIQTASPAAGRVFAKTGTFEDSDLLNASTILTAKGLAGYTTTVTGEHVAFAIYVNSVPLATDAGDSVKTSDAIKNVGQQLGEIAAAANLYPIEPMK